MDVKAILPVFSRLPRPVLVLLALAGGGYAAQTEVSWRQDVAEHVEKSVDGYQRLTAVEKQVSNLHEELRGLRREQQELRVDQLQFYRWLAEHQFGDERKARELSQRLKDLNGGKP